MENRKDLDKSYKLPKGFEREEKKGEKEADRDEGSGHEDYASDDGELSEELLDLRAKMGAHWADIDENPEDFKDRHVTGHNKPQQKMGGKFKSRVENNSMSSGMRKAMKEEDGFSEFLHSWKAAHGMKGASLTAEQQEQMMADYRGGNVAPRQAPPAVLPAAINNNNHLPPPPATVPLAPPTTTPTPTTTTTPTPTPVGDFYTDHFQNITQRSNADDMEDIFGGGGGNRDDLDGFL